MINLQAYIGDAQPIRARDTPSTRKRLRTAVDNQRAEFLRMCRARTKPSDLGLPETPRRRTGGLRREDVAVLSGVSVSWYTWLEQGRDMRVSDQTLERISQTFRLSEDEHVYLFSLVQRRVPRLSPQSPSEAPPDILRMISSMNCPAIVMNLRWDVLAWNRLNTVIFRDYAALPPAQRNLLDILLVRPVDHISPEDLQNTARRMISRLRFDYSKNPDDPKFETLIRRLSMQSAIFRSYWPSPEFTLRAYGLHRFTHKRFGTLTFEHTSVVPDGCPNIRVVICTPENAAARRAIALANDEVTSIRS